MLEGGGGFWVCRQARAFSLVSRPFTRCRDHVIGTACIQPDHVTFAVSEGLEDGARPETRLDALSQPS